MGSEQLPWGEQTISYAAPFRRLTMKDAIAEHGALDRALLDDDTQIRALAQAVHVEDAATKSAGMLLGDLFEHYA